ncbi:VOC family protein [Pseudarthrobacter sp. P1]|uniref:VOC family protein n=1 Tax=Pseudarthrobacter sp. P1 TaxID=3418418 RepID=UPI003CF11070
MKPEPVIVSLPIADRQRAFAFYAQGLGLIPVGPVADDGVPEPLQFTLNDGVRLMLIPRGGFRWVVGGRDVAAGGSSECFISISTGSASGVDDLVERARQAGAEIVTEPGQQPWGYAGAFADLDGHIWQATSSGPPD